MQKTPATSSRKRTARGDPATQDEIVYTNFPVMAELAYTNQEQFIDLMRKNKVKDFSKYVGFDLT